MCDWWIIDNTFYTYLNNASQFLQLANSDCSRVNPAWTNWRQYVAELQQVGERVRGQTDGKLLNANAKVLLAKRDAWADDLGYQIIANRFERRPTCEEHYYRFGFDLGTALISMNVAGSVSVADADRARAHENGLRAINRARTVLDSLAQVRPVTGACVDLSSLRARLLGVPQAIDPFQNAEPIRAMVQELVPQADALLLAGCGRGAALDPRSLAGMWRVWFISRNPQSGPPETGGGQVELTLTPGQLGMLIGVGRSDTAREWQVVGNDVIIYDANGQLSIRFRYIDARTMVLIELNQGGVRQSASESDESRIEMRR
jgi:hypothetical protein